MFSGLISKDVVPDFINTLVNTPKKSVPDSHIKGRPLTVAEGCGLRKPESMDRIVGGGPARNGLYNESQKFI